MKNMFMMLWWYCDKHYDSASRCDTTYTYPYRVRMTIIFSSHCNCLVFLTYVVWIQGIKIENSEAFSSACPTTISPSEWYFLFLDLLEIRPRLNEIGSIERITFQNNIVWPNSTWKRYVNCSVFLQQHSADIEVHSSKQIFHILHTCTVNYIYTQYAFQWINLWRLLEFIFLEFNFIISQNLFVLVEESLVNNVLFFSAPCKLHTSQIHY